MDERTPWAYPARVAMIERDAIVDEVPVERESAVERLASLVYRLLLAYVWFWVLLVALMFIGFLVKVAS